MPQTLGTSRCAIMCLSGGAAPVLALSAFGGVEAAQANMELMMEIRRRLINQREV